MKNDFAKLLDDYENIRPRNGQIVRGEVLECTEDTVLLDVGAKRDAVVPRRELANLDEVLLENISIGDQLPVCITNTSSYDDELLVSIEKGLEEQDWERAKNYLENEETVDLEITGYNKGGLVVKFDRLNGFVPNSLIPGLPRGLRRTEKQNAKSKMIGNSIQVQAIEVNPARKRLILSGKAAQSRHSKERLREIEVGEKLTGTVSNVVDFGAFVALDGVDGLIHTSLLSWEEFDHPSDVLKPGDEVKVLVKDVDVERERLSLDRKSLLPNPWDGFEGQYDHGDILEGEVVSLRDFGAFVKLTDHITGLLHVSEFLPGVSNEPEKVLNPGDKVLVRIIEIDTQRERVSLSMRRIPEDDLVNWVIESQNNPSEEKY